MSLVLMERTAQKRVRKIFAETIQEIRTGEGVSPFNSRGIPVLLRHWRGALEQLAGDSAVAVMGYKRRNRTTKVISYWLFIMPLAGAEQVRYVAGDSAGKPRVVESRRLNPLGAFGTNPLLDMAGMSRLEVAHAMDQLCRRETDWAMSTLCHHLIDHPENMVAASAAVRAAGWDTVPSLVRCLTDASWAAVENAAFLLGEFGDQRAYVHIDKLHMIDRGVFRGALKKIERAAAGRVDRQVGLHRIEFLCRSWSMPGPEKAAPDKREWPLWDLEALVDRVDATNEPWWAFWRDEDAVAGAWARLKLADDSIEIIKGTRPLFRVNLRSHAAVQVVRVDSPEPLGGILVRIVASDYRTAEVVEIGTLAKRDEIWEALPAEDRRDVLYLAPAHADVALAAIRAALDGGPG